MNDAIDSDSDLLQRIAAKKDEQAFSLLYDRYSALVYGLAIRMIEDETAAEDIVIEVFERLWRHAKVYQRQIASARTWISTITRNCTIDEFRRRRSRPDGLQSKQTPIVPESISDPASREASVDDHIQRQQIREFLARLTDAQRESIELAYFKGYSHRQIATRLDLPLGTVKTRIRTAMQRLRQLLEAGDAQ